MLKIISIFGLGSLQFSNQKWNLSGDVVTLLQWYRIINFLVTVYEEKYSLWNKKRSSVWKKEEISYRNNSEIEIGRQKWRYNLYTLSYCSTIFWLRSVFLQYGEIEEMNVCDNLGDHLVGNVYIKVIFYSFCWQFYIVAFVFLINLQRRSTMSMLIILI